MFSSKGILGASAIFCIYFNIVHGGNQSRFDCTYVHNCKPISEAGKAQANTATTKRDDLISYKSVLISFRQIMEPQTESLPSIEDIGLEDEIKLKMIRSWKPSEEEIYQRAKFDDLLRDAINLVKSYETDIVKNCDYREAAYQYRILNWLMFNMRKQDKKIHELETVIYTYLNGQFDMNSEQNRIIMLFFKGKKAEQDCQSITVMEQLEKFGSAEDEILVYCLLLAKEKKRTGAGQTLEVADLMTVWRSVYPYEKLLSEIGSRDESFRGVVGFYPFQILEDVYDTAVIRVWRYFYDRPPAQTIKLEPKHNDELNLKYYRDMMIIFDNAIESELLPRFKGKGTFYEVLRLENFPVADYKEFKSIRGDALQDLAEFVLTQRYQQAVLKIPPANWKKENTQCYGRLLEWLQYYLEKKVPPQHTDSIKIRVNGIRATVNAGAPSDPSYSRYEDPTYEPEYTLNEDEYEKINTVELLVEFCKTGKPPTDFSPEVSSLLDSTIEK